jgi:serine/threonine protein kinase
MPKFEHLKHFKEIKTLNTGGFAVVKVYKCQEVHDIDNVCNRLFVVKRLFRRKQSEIEIDNMMYNEFFHCSILKHDNIIKVFDVDPESKSLTFEYFQGIDLYDYLEKNSIIEPRLLIAWFSQLIDAVCYLHSNQVAHMDIKPENIVINLEEAKIKLIDFGHAIHFDNEREYDNVWGTECYMTPEMMFHQGYYPDKVDVWCCGLVLYNMLYNKMPWADCKCEKYQKAKFYLTHNILDPFVFTDHELIATLGKVLVESLQPSPVKRSSSFQIKSLLLQS